MPTSSRSNKLPQLLAAIVSTVVFLAVSNYLIFDSGNRRIESLSTQLVEVHQPSIQGLDMVRLQLQNIRFKAHLISTQAHDANPEHFKSGEEHQGVIESVNTSTYLIGDEIAALSELNKDQGEALFTELYRDLIDGLPGFLQHRLILGTEFAGINLTGFDQFQRKVLQLNALHQQREEQLSIQLAATSHQFKQYHLYFAVLSILITAAIIAKMTMVIQKTFLEQLSLQQAHLAVLEGIPGGILECDLSGLVLYSNSGCARIAGRTSDLVINRPIQDCIPELQGSQALVSRLQSLAAKQGQENGCETKLIDLQGQEVNIQLNWRFDREESSQAEKIFFSVTDISRRVHAERDQNRLLTAQRLSEIELVESESRYRALVEDTSDWVWQMDLDHNTTYSNHQLESLLGYTAEEIAALPIEQLVHPDDMAEIRSSLPLLIAQKQGWPSRVIRNKHKNGSYRFLDSNASPILDATGALIGSRGISRDVTFETLLIRISTDLMATSLNDGLIEAALEEWADYFAVDAIELRWFDESREVALLAHSWKLPRIPEIPSSYRLSDLQWLESQISAGKTANVSDSKEIPEGVEFGRTISNRLGVTAFAVVPLKTVDAREHIGTGVVSMYGATRNWSDREMEELQLAFNVVAAAEARLRSEIELKAREGFQALLSEISTYLLAAQLSEIDDRIYESLGKIAHFYAIDRVSLWRFEDNNLKLRCINSWAFEGLDTRLNVVLNLDTIPWGSSRLLAGSMVKLDSMDDIPAEQTRDKAFYELLGVQSSLAIPIAVDDQNEGTGIFASVQQLRSWTDREAHEFRLLSEAVMNAYSRSQSNKEVVQRERDLARAESLAHVGSYTFHPSSAPGVRPPRGKITCSNELLTLLGCTAQEATAELIVSRVHPDDQQRVIDTIGQRFELEPHLGEVTQEYRVVRPGNDIIYIEDRTLVERDPNSGELAVFASLKDITQRVHRESELKDTLAEVSTLKEQLQEENVNLREEIQLTHSHNQIVGESPQIKRVLNTVEKIAPTDVSVLIEGETGTGKELIARAIHDLSLRNGSSMISVNCAALSESLIESELFGHERGAFTGAVKQRKGRFELADKGSLFLDEIGELPLELQAKLLRVLQTGIFERLGGSETIQVDVRVIAATNRDLQRSVDNGEFRADLFYRINSFPIYLPPLRERQGDIPLLTEYFIHKYASKVGREVTSISPHMLRHLEARSWPGNARELESFIEYTLISGNGPVLDYDEQLSERPKGSESEDLADPDTSLHGAERKHIRRVLDNTGWKIAGEHGAASLLGIPPSTLRSKMKRLGIASDV